MGSVFRLKQQPGRYWVSGISWPDRKQELLLQAAFWQGDRAVEAWRQWRSRVDLGVEHLDRASYRLVPLLYRNLSVHGVDDPWMGRLKGVTRLAWYKNQRAFRSGTGAIEALHLAGIRTLLVNDVALALQCCDGLFPGSVDSIDVLVPSDKAAAAVTALLQSGWQPCNPPVAALDDAVFRLAPGCSLRDHLGLLLRLHWQLPIQAGGVAGSRVWTASVPLHVSGLDVRALCAAHQLVLVCARGLLSIHAPATGWVADAMVVLNSNAAEMDWHQVIELAGELRLGLVMRSALRYLASGMGASIPVVHLQRLDTLPAAWAERCEFQVFNRMPGVVGSLPRCWFRYRRRLWQLGKSGSWLEDLAGFRAYLCYQEEHLRLRAVVEWLGRRGVQRTNRNSVRGG